jgi:hypothetical protein
VRSFTAPGEESRKIKSLEFTAQNMVQGKRVIPMEKNLNFSFFGHNV